MHRLLVSVLSMKKLLIVLSIFFVGAWITMRNLSAANIHRLYGDTITQYSVLYGFSITWSEAVIMVESGGYPFAVGGTSDFGLMQITQPALTDFNRAQGTKLTLLDIWLNPTTNMKVGVWYLSWLYKQFNSDMKLTISAYNQGIGNVKNDHFSLDYWEKVEKAHSKVIGVVK